MKRALIALLLSALVFPGLGQFYNRERRKGLFLVVAANVLAGLLLLLGLILFSSEYQAVYYPRAITGAIAKTLLLDTVYHPLFLIPCCLLIALWAFGVVDAARGPRQLPASPPQEDNP
jgi:TM2 domain-containing membrane protein YozV